MKDFRHTGKLVKNNDDPMKYHRELLAHYQALLNKQRITLKELELDMALTLITVQRAGSFIKAHEEQAKANEPL